MIRTIISRFRMVAPPTWIMVGMILVFGILAIPRILFGLQPLPGNEPAAAARRYLIVASIGLGIYRAVAFHPYFRPNYLRWLKSTPWTVRKQLPLGPLELVPEDSFAIGMLILLSAALPTPRSIELVNLFLFSHMLTQVGTFWRTGAPGFGYTAVMLLGFVPLFWAHPWLNLVILTSIYLVVHEGLWRSLKGFPWETEGILADFHMLQTNETNPACGWFFDRFHRDVVTAKAISRIDALLGCMLGSWWLFVLASLIRDRGERFSFLVVCMVLSPITCSSLRLATYIQGCRAPISFWGRIRTFRWVIAGFDQVLIGPACSLLVGPAALSLFRHSRVPAEVFFSIAVGLTLLIALISPPSLKRWRLTGQHRLVPTFQESQAATVHKMGQA